MLVLLCINLLNLLLLIGKFKLNTAQIGKIKYSNEKLFLVAYLKNSTGYSMSLNSTTRRPTNHVIDNLKRKMSWASRILLFGMNSKSIMIVKPLN